MEGLVTDLEQMEAALFGGYKWKEYLELERPFKILLVAFFRIHHMVEHHSEDAVMVESERRAKAKK